jgi:hypothetical protein
MFKRIKIIGASLILCGVALFAYKSYADVASLPQGGLKSGDLIQIYRAGVAYSVNWSDLQRLSVTNTNWQAVGSLYPNTGVNWVYPNAYIGS